MEVKVWKENPIPLGNENEFYLNNRTPLLSGPFIKLPVGNVRALGWLQYQLQLMTEGMTGRLPEISKWCKLTNNAWISPTGEGENHWEEVPYWLKGFISLGYLLDDKRIINESTVWVEGILSSQQKDGYFGPKSNRFSNDIWPNMVMVYVLRSFYESTGDDRIIPFLIKYFYWQHNLPLHQFLAREWQKTRAGDNLDSIYWLYNHTGEPWLLDLARINHERADDWVGGIPTWHGVNICQGFREPAQYYQQTKDKRYLNSTERNYQMVMQMYGQMPGGMFAADENCRSGYTSPRQGAETCSMAEFMFSFELLLKITGNPIWADRCEDIAFNSFPAAQTSDLKGLHYLTAANQVQLDITDKSPMVQNGGNMFAYSPYEDFRCCQHNVAFGWPYFTEHLWMATRDNGIAAVMYAPSEVKVKVGAGINVLIKEQSDYPFKGNIEFTVIPEKGTQFPFLFRIPGWCKQVNLVVNGKPVDIKANQLSYIEITRDWQPEDKVLLELGQSVTLRKWTSNCNAISVDRGPLTYSIKINEKWKQYAGSDKWPTWEVYPKSSWNYGLQIDPNTLESSFTINEKNVPISAQPFTLENTPIELKVKGKRIPQWQQEKNGMVGELWLSPVQSNEPIEEVTLIPMGCARLRVSAIPILGDKSNANTWGDESVLPVEKPNAYASNCWPWDPLDALTDGIIPQNSNDTSMPRFTWYDHRSTSEWVQFTFPRTRLVSFCEIYWFDDRKTSNICLIPVKWRVLWNDGGTWHEVSNATGYPVELDTFNRVDFQPVKAKEIRVEVQLQDGFSAGILEWRVGLKV